MTTPKVGEVYEAPAGSRWRVDYIGTGLTLVTCVTAGQTGWLVGDERSFVLDSFEKMTLIKPWFQLGKKYRKKGIPGRIYTVQSLYQNGDHKLAVLFYKEASGVGGVDAAIDHWFDTFEEIV